VVGAEAEVASRACGLLLSKRWRLAQQPLDRIVREAEPDEEAEDAGEVREEERDVVLARVGEVVEDGGDVAAEDAQTIGQDLDGVVRAFREAPSLAVALGRPESRARCARREAVFDP